jgi:hypothetical protein
VAADLTGDDLPLTSADLPPMPNAVPTVVRPHRLRFALIYGGLGLVLIAAIAAVAVVTTRSVESKPAWSAWQPTGGGLGAAQEIADHVSKSYRLPNGDQLVDVITKAPSITPSSATLPIHYVAIKGTKGQADQLYPLSSTNSVMYSMCGLGTSCEIASGTPSVERGRLVRREILELALYTFKYAHGIQNVIALMPTTPGKTAKYVVYLRKSDLDAKLKQPLDTTLGNTVPLAKAIPLREVHLIDSTTVPRLYSLGVAQAPQGDLVFVFSPAPA